MAGGRNPFPIEAGELFSPATGQWSATTNSARSGRYDQSASRLPSGDVLVSGGFDGFTPRRTVDLFDPVAGWAPVTSATAPLMTTQRTAHTSTLLLTDRVLVAGGGAPNTAPVFTAELYDAVADGWISTGSLQTARSRHTATLLSGPGCLSLCGQVLIAGGSTGTAVPLAGAELYDPAAQPVAGRVADLAAAAQSDGRIVLTFGAPGSDGRAPTPASRYVIAQATEPIGDGAAFGRATTLCGGACAFSPTAIGERITLTVSGLAPGTEYHYALRAQGAGGAPGALSNPASATTPRADAPPAMVVPPPDEAVPAVAPGAVAALTARAISPHRVRLAFATPAEGGDGTGAATAYLVKRSGRSLDGVGAFERAPSSCGGTCRIAARAAGARAQIVVTEVEPNQTYHFALRARSGAGLLGPLSPSVRVRTPADRVAPGPVTAARARAALAEHGAPHVPRPGLGRAHRAAGRPLRGPPGPRADQQRPPLRTGAAAVRAAVPRQPAARRGRRHPGCRRPVPADHVSLRDPRAGPGRERRPADATGRRSHAARSITPRLLIGCPNTAAALYVAITHRSWFTAHWPFKRETGMRRTQPLAALVISLLALPVIGAALAWACSPSAEITVDQSGVAQSGQSVSVTGRAFEAGGRVEIRWNSAGGPVLATAVGPSFTTSVTIPAAQADAHTLVAIGYEAPPEEETVAGQSSATVRVGPVPTPGGGGAGTSGQADGGASSSGTGPATASAPDSPGGSQPSTAQAASPTKTSKRAGAGSATSARTSGREPTRGLGRSPRTAAGGQAAEPVLVGDQAVIAGTVPATAARRTGSRDRTRTGSSRDFAASSQRSAAAPSERSAVADAWSGFAASNGASLATRSSEGVVDSGGGTGMVGLALLGFGIAALLGGALTLQLRRRRVLGR